MFPSPTINHQTISRNFSTPISNYLNNKKCQVFYAPFDVRLPIKDLDVEGYFNVVQPDIGVICEPTKLSIKGCIGAPDIVIEILSSGNNSKELKKYNLYEAVGVLEY